MRRIYELQCPRCSEIWEIMPTKWRNLNSVISSGRKKIHCPFCGKLITLSKEATKTMLKVLQESRR